MEELTKTNIVTKIIPKVQVINGTNNSRLRKYGIDERINSTNGLDVSSPKHRKLIIDEEELSIDLIKTQILDVKKPQMKLTLFPEMYSCSNCSEMFYTEMGLIEHQQREIFNALLNCSVCSRKRSFVNRCQILNHLKSHGLSPTIENLRGALVFQSLSNSFDKDFFLDFSISIPTNHPGYSPTAPTTIVPSQMMKIIKSTSNDHNSSQLSLQSAQSRTFLRGDRQFKIIPVNNIKSSVSSSNSSSPNHYSSSFISLPSGLSVNITNNMSPCSPSSTSTISPKSSIYYCSICVKNFTDGISFMEHIEKSNSAISELSTCSSDGVPLRSQCERNLHTRIFHDKRPPFLCLECGTEFMDLETLKCHDQSLCFHQCKILLYTCAYVIASLDDEEEDYSQTDQFCDEDSKNNGDCSSRTNSNKEVVSVCGMQFRSRKQLLKHLGEHYRDIFRCNLCPQAALTEESLQEHIENRHPEELAEQFQESSDAKKGFQCLICSRIFYTRSSFTSHLEITPLEEHSILQVVYNCRKCLEIFGDLNSLSEHILTDPICSISTEEFKEAQQRAYGPDSVQLGRSPHPRATVSRCNYCHVLFPSVRSLKRHTPHCDAKLTTLQSRSRAETCRICMKGIIGSRNILPHGLGHLNTGINLCLYCNNQPLNEKDEVNEETQQNILREHLWNEHIEKMICPITCMFCIGSEFVDMVEAHAHFLSHHQRIINRFKCSICGDLLDSVQELSSHKTLNHGQGTCLTISPSITSVSSPIKGTQIRPSSLAAYSYKCKYCKDKVFQTRPGLRKHLRNIHKHMEFTMKDWMQVRSLRQADSQNSSMEIQCSTTEEITSTNQTPSVLPGTSLPSDPCKPMVELRRSQRERRVSVHRNPPGSSNVSGSISSRRNSSASAGKNAGTNEDEVFMGEITNSTLSARNFLDGTFRCLKCLISCNENGTKTDDNNIFYEETEFYEHIRTTHVWPPEDDTCILADDELNEEDKLIADELAKLNASKDKSYWCPECNVEFVAMPSLRMHLISSHPYIKNVGTYLDEVGYGNKVRPLQKNQCCVCRKRFLDTSTYERHRRTHGMAFLSQRLQRASSSS